MNHPFARKPVKMDEAHRHRPNTTPNSAPVQNTTPKTPNTVPANTVIQTVNTAAIADIQQRLSAITSSISSILSCVNAISYDLANITTTTAIPTVPVPVPNTQPANSTPTPVPNTTPTPVPNTTPKPVPTPSTGVQWPSFTGTATLVGSSPSGRMTVYYDASLGAEALQNAQDLVSQGDVVASFNDAVFATPGSNVDVIVFALGGMTDGTGGADHMGCDWLTGNVIEVDASFGSSARVLALLEAEYSECAMKDQLCGYSTGEALSRWCAMTMSGNALSDFATAPTWYQDGMANWVDQTAPTDQDPDSIGCGMAFISYLIHQGYTLSDVAQAMVSLGTNGTLAQLYETLGQGSADSAWTVFSGAVRAHGQVDSDDPFGMAGAAMRRRQIQRV